MGSSVNNFDDGSTEEFSIFKSRPAAVTGLTSISSGTDHAHPGSKPLTETQHNQTEDSQDMPSPSQENTEADQIHAKSDDDSEQPTDSKQEESSGNQQENTDGKAEEAVETLSPEQEASMLETAEALKAEGNTLYGQGQHEAATEKYAEALEAAPPNAHKQRAVYLANMAACDVALKQYKEAIQACSAALEEEPNYVKAFMRRAMAYKALDDLDHALSDAKKVLELDSSNSWANKTVKELEPIVAQRHEKLKDEMLGKLKDLGNTILGKFGLSLDNFKAEKDPNSGGYSIKFQQ